MKVATLIVLVLATWVVWYRLLIRLLFRGRHDVAVTGARKAGLLASSGLLAVVGTPALLFGFGWITQTYLS